MILSIAGMGTWTAAFTILIIRAIVAMPGIATSVGAAIGRTTVPAMAAGTVGICLKRQYG